MNTSSFGCHPTVFIMIVVVVVVVGFAPLSSADNRLNDDRD